MAEYLDMRSNLLTTEMKVSSALKQRRIFLSDEITRESLFEVSYFLYKLQDIDLKTNTKEPIELIISSRGGYILDGNMLISLIEQMKDMGYEIITTVGAYAFSMGFMIALVGSKRQSYRYGSFLLHQPSSGNWGTLKEQQEDIKETEKLWELMKTIVKKYSKITDEKLDEIYKCKTDFMMNPQEALELNVIDLIL